MSKDDDWEIFRATWPDESFHLTRYLSENLGASIERSMATLTNGYGGVRSAQTIQHDGSICQLTTRGGWPIYETIDEQVAIPTILAAGFLANAGGESTSALFNPYDLSMINPSFTPPRVAYWVSDVPVSGDLNRWCHVYSRDESGQMRINNQPAEDYFGAFHWPASTENDSVPYIIPYDGQPTEPFGTPDQNDDYDAMIIFVIGSYSVGSCTYSEQDVIQFGGGAYLTHRTPIGSLIDQDTHRAWLMTAAGNYDLPWDYSAQDGWRVNAFEVQMQAPPADSLTLLQSYDAGIGTSAVAGTLGVDSYEYDDIVTTFDGPEIDVGLSGVGEMYESVAYGGALAVKRDIVWPWQTAVRGQPTIQQNNGQVDAVMVSGGNESAVYGGWTIACTSENRVEVTRKSLAVFIREDLPVHVANHTTNYSSLSLSAAGTGGSQYLFWGEAVPPDPPITPGSIEATRGMTDFIVNNGITYNSDMVAEGYDTTQTGHVEISNGAAILLRLDFSRQTQYGKTYELVPVEGLYQGYLDHPYEWIDAPWGTGYASHAFLNAYTDPATDESPITHYKEIGFPPPPHQSSETIAEINDTFDDMAGAMISQTNYDNPFQLAGPNRYEFVLNDRPGLLSAAITWTTRDYLLYDEDRHVYVWIEGYFHVEKGNDAYLRVRLHLQTAAGTSNLLLYELTFAYPDLLPLMPIGGISLGGEDAYVPLPYVRMTFAPLWTHQGHAPGIVYVTPDEVSGGAQHTILGNFVLVLRRYDLHSDGQPSDGSVHFTPYQLVDMLYAYVYGRGYGWPQEGRGYYYVDDTDLFEQLDNELFGVPWHLQFDDFVFVDWKSSLGSAYSADDTTKLYRV